MLKRNSLIGAVLLLQVIFLSVGFFRYGDHPDELGARIMDLIPWAKWTPFNYYYPTTHVYTLKLLSVSIADLLYFKLNWVDTYDHLFYNRIGRVITSSMAVAITLFLYRIAMLLNFSCFSQIVMALFWVCFPLAVNLSRFNTTDIPNIFWILLSYTYFLGVLNSNISKRRCFTLGLLLGATAGVKYLGVLIVPGILIGLFLHLNLQLKLLRQKSILFAIMCGIGVIVGGLFTTPAVLFDAHKFFADLAFLSAKVPTWEGQNAPIGLVGVPLKTMHALNLGVLLFAGCGLVFGVKQFGSKNIPQTVFCINLLIYFVFISRSHFYPQRFIMPLYIHLIIFAGLGLNQCLECFKKKSILLRTVQTAAVFALVWDFGRAATIALNFVNETRFKAAEWLGNNNSDGLVLLPLKICTYFPVPFIPLNRIEDSKGIDPLLVSGRVEYGMTSEFYNPPPTTSEAAINDAISQWKVVKQFDKIDFPGYRLSETEFLCPQITIYENPGFVPEISKTVK